MFNDLAQNAMDHQFFLFRFDGVMLYKRVLSETKQKKYKICKLGESSILPVWFFCIGILEDPFCMIFCIGIPEDPFCMIIS